MMRPLIIKCSGSSNVALYDCNQSVLMIQTNALFVYTYIHWLIIYSFTSRSRIFHWYGDVTIAGEGLQISVLRAPEQGGVFIVPHLLWVTRDLGFSGLIRGTAPCSHLLRHTRGCGGSILTRILTGVYIYMYSYALYDTQCMTDIQPYVLLSVWSYSINQGEIKFSTYRIYSANKKGNLDSLMGFFCNQRRNINRGLWAAENPTSGMQSIARSVSHKRDN
jgi:hypothetical protein